MKKVLSVILVAMMITMMLIPIGAHSDNNSLGNVPKTETAPAIDGEKDDVYNQGLYVSVRNPHSATPDGGLGGGADAWLLWDDTSLYIFMNVDVKGYFHPDDYDTRQSEVPWDLTTVEVLLDFTNATGDDTEDVFQFRLNDSGFANATLGKSTPWLNGDDCNVVMQTGSVKSGSSYTAEIKLDFTAIKADGEPRGLNFGSAWEAGKQIGIYLFSQEIGADGSGSALFISNPTDRSGNWVPSIYDYIVLGDEIVGVVEVVAAEEPVNAPTAEVSAPVAAVAAPQTSDTALAGITALIISCAGLLIFNKKK